MKKDKKKLNSNEIFNRFKKNNIPLPVIQIKINDQNKLIEEILHEMDANYSIRKLTNEKKHNSLKRSRNILNTFKFNKINEKINIGPVTYLTYKETQDDDLNISKYTFEDLRKKLVDSKNFRIGFYTMKNKNIHLSQNFSNTNLTDRKTSYSKKKLSINPYTEYKNIKKKEDRISEYKNKVENEVKDEFSNNIYSDINSEHTENKNNKSKFKEIKTLSSFNDNNKDNSDINDTNINFISSKNKSHSSRNWKQLKKTNSLPYRTNIGTFYNKANLYKSDINIKHRYNLANSYINKNKPIDLKEKNIKNKTSNKITDFKDLLKYYKTENNFLNNTKSNNNNSNNYQIKPIDMVNELFDIKDVAEYQQAKLNYLAKKNLKLKLIERKLKKNTVSNSVIDLLAGKKHKKIKLRATMNKMKKQIKHLFIVDQIEKFSDNIPSEKVKTFHKEYSKKSEKIGISDNLITLNNGKHYHQAESESKKLNEKVEQNYLEIYRLRNQILIDRYYFEANDLKYKKLGEQEEGRIHHS